MGEGTPSSGTHEAPRARTWGWTAGLFAGGTAVAALAAVLGLQFISAQSGQAAGEPAAASSKQPAQRKSPEAMARVGKEIVSFDMLAEECVARHGREVLDDLIHRMIIQQACDTAGLSVSEDEVNQEVARIAKRFNLDPPNWYAMLQAERNITPQQYRQSVIWPMLALKKLAGEQVAITEQEIDEAFVRNYGPRVKVRMIMLDNERRAREVWEKCKEAPDEFESLAEKHSIDPTSRALGGSAPPIPKFSGSPEIEKAAFRLKEGEISGLIQVQSNRFVILKCEGRTNQIVTEIDEVRDSLYDELLEAKTQQAVAKVFDGIKKNARVDNYYAGTSTAPARPAAAPNATTGIQPTSGKVPAGEPGAARVKPAAAANPAAGTSRK